MSEVEGQSGTTFHQHSIESPIGRIAVVEAVPQLLTSDIPIVIAPGWAETPPVFEKTQTVLSNLGRKSFAYGNPRHGGKLENNTEFPDAEFRKAMALIHTIDTTGTGSADVIAHSEGTIYALIAATLHPEKFRNIVLISPARVIGQDTLPALAGRMLKKEKRYISQGVSEYNTHITTVGGKKVVEKSKVSRQDQLKISRQVLLAHLRAIQYVAENPKRALEEGVAISKSDITDMLINLRQKGIGIVVIHHADDEAFPMNRIQNTIKINTGSSDTDFPTIESGSMLDGILAVAGRHDDILVHPEKYAFAANEMLIALEKKRTTHTQPAT